MQNKCTAPSFWTITGWNWHFHQLLCDFSYDQLHSFIRSHRFITKMTIFHHFPLSCNYDEMSVNSRYLHKVGSHMIIGQNVPRIPYARGVRFWARCRSLHEYVTQHLKHFNDLGYACFDLWNCKKGVNSTQNGWKTWFLGSFLDAGAVPDVKMAVSHRDRVEMYLCT